MKAHSGLLLWAERHSEEDALPMAAGRDSSNCCLEGLCAWPWPFTWLKRGQEVQVEDVTRVRSMCPWLEGVDSTIAGEAWCSQGCR